MSAVDDMSDDSFMCDSNHGCYCGLGRIAAEFFGMKAGGKDNGLQKYDTAGVLRKIPQGRFSCRRL